MIHRNVLNRIDSLYFFVNSRCFSTVKSRPKLAIVGSGPAGMFTCNSLLRRSDVTVDVFEYSPVPFGLVRYGVAPDHQEVKNVINTFDAMFERNRDRLRLFCNVNIGKDLTFKELTENYDAVLLAYGSYKTRQLNIPGTDAKNVISGSSFVGWYNGVPNAPYPDLDVENVIIVGNGNVALDCTRVLSTAASVSLRSSDIPGDRLELLEKSPINNIKVLGRRGPENVSFTIKELKEQFKVSDWSSRVEIDDEDKQKLIDSLPNLDRKKKRLTEVIIKHVGKADGPKKCQFLFHRLPQEILTTRKDGRIEGVRILNSKTAEIEEVPCELLIYSIGYQTLILDGIPQNEHKMIDMSDHCRVNMDEKCKSKVYATGWCAHGPRGVIVDSQQQSVFVAEEISQDLEDFNSSAAPTVDYLLKKRNVPFISWDEWKQIDNQEKENGKQTGKIREKFTTFDRFLRK